MNHQILKHMNVHIIDSIWNPDSTNKIFFQSISKVVTEPGWISFPARQTPIACNLYYYWKLKKKLNTRQNQWYCTLEYACIYINLITVKQIPQCNSWSSHKKHQMPKRFYPIVSCSAKEKMKRLLRRCWRQNFHQTNGCIIS